MPVTPVAGVPPLSTLQKFDRGMANFRPYYVAPGLTKGNFYTQNGQIILAAIVAIMLIILFFIDSVGKISTGAFF